MRKMSSWELCEAQSPRFYPTDNSRRGLEAPYELRSSGSSPPARSSATKSSKPPTWVSPM